MEKAESAPARARMGRVKISPIGTQGLGPQVEKDEDRNEGDLGVEGGDVIGAGDAVDEMGVVKTDSDADEPIAKVGETI